MAANRLVNEPVAFHPCQLGNILASLPLTEQNMSMPLLVEGTI